LAILDFMPKFAPWHTKTLLKKEDEPATDPSTGFFGDVFNFIADDFGWEPRPEPVEPDWGGAQVGAGFGEAAPAYEPYVEPDYSGMGDPFGMTDPFTEEEWVSAPSTPSPFSGPILGGMFGSAPPSPTPGIGETIGGSLGSGEGWGFDLVDEPTQSWAGYAPPPSPTEFAGGIAGGMFAPQTLPTSYPDISEQWQANDWVAAPPRESFGGNFGLDFRDRLDASIGERDPWADVQNWEGMPAPDADTSQWNQLAGVPGNGIGSAIGDTFSGFGADLGARIQEPIEFQQWEPWGGEWAGGVRGAGVATPEYNLRNDWSMFGNGDQGLGMMPQGWEQMSPKERGEFVYFSGLRGNDYLSENDYANMPVDLKQKIGYTDSRIEGGGLLNNGFSKLWEGFDVANSNMVQPIGDAVYDVVNQDVIGRGLNELGINPFGKEYEPLQLPFDDTIGNVREASNPLDFATMQHEDFKDRPFAEQILLQILTPGSGIYKNVEGLPSALTAFDRTIDLAQGGALLDNIGTIPGASFAVKNVIAPGGAGFVAGAGADAIFNPTYTDEWGNEYNPSWWESGLGVGATAILGNQAMKRGTVPFGAGMVDDLGGFILPKGLAGAKPSYGYGDKLFTLQFEDDLDKALYIVRNSANKSKADEQYMGALRGFFPDLDDVAIRSKGEEVASAIKSLAKNAPKPAAKSAPLPIPTIANRSIDELSTVPPSVASPVDEIIGSSTVPPAAPKTLKELQEEVRLSDLDAAAAMFSPGAVAPSPSVADDVVDAAVTPPVTTSSPVVAGGAADIPTLKPVISRPVPADLSPAARNAVEQIDAKLDNLIGVDSGLRRAEYDSRVTQIAADARKAAKGNPNLSDVEKLNAGNAATSDLTIDDLVPIVDDPGPLRLSTEEMNEVARVINNRKLDDRIKSAASRILRKWASGEKVYKSELDTLRTAITGTWNPKGPRTINSIVPPSTVVADGAVDAIPPATTLPVPKGADVDKPVPGMKQPINKTIDEVADLPLSPAEKNTIGVDDDFFMEEPIDVEEDEWVDINDWWRDDDVITPGAKVGPPKPRRTPLWKTALDDAQREADDQIIDFTKPAVADDVIDFTSSVKKTNPVIQEVDAWEKQMLARGQGADPEKFQKELDRSMTELVARLGPDSVKPAQFSHDRIPGRIARLAETEKADRLALASNEAIADWRRVNLDELKDIPIDAKSSWGERYVGGALKNKLADQLTLRGRELSEYLQKQGYTFEESKAIVNAELARYLDDRVLREASNGNSAAILDRAMTALHMGDFQPNVKGVNVPQGTGDVAKFVDIGRTANSTLKNMSFGIADVGALMANAIPAVQAQPHTILLGYLNRILRMVDLGVDLDEAKRLRELSGLATGSSQDVIDEKVGTLVGITGRYLQGTGATGAGDALVKIDQVPVAFNRVLEKAQFDLVLDKSLRQPIYEGNLVLMSLLGRDINTSDARRAAARIANAVTSTAPLARGNTRRGIEGASLGSARFLRAQVDLILAASKIINPKATAEERIVAATTIAGLIGTFVLAKAVHGESMEADWDDPYSFGQILMPGGIIMPSLQQRQLAMAFNKSTQELAKVVSGNDGDVSKIFDPWIQFTISRAGPLAQYPLKLAGIGYDPKEDRYSYPGKGRTPFGASMDTSERIMAALPIPVGATAWAENEGPLWSKIANVAGAGTRPEDAFATALRKEGFDTLDEMKEAWNKEDPTATAAKLAKFYKDNPSLFDQDTALADNQEARKENSEKFMESDYKFLVGDWREEKKRLSDRVGGIYDEMGIEEKERPEEDGSLQWVYDYNELFKKALVDTDNTAKGMDMEKLGDLQAEFWTEHSEPEVRKAIIAYQLEKADTEADRLWIKSMARLNGIDPETGNPLTTPSGKKNLPNYFNMERYRYKEINNEDAQDVLARFEQWRNSLPERYVESEKREDLLRQFILEKDELSYRPDSKPWTPTAINDVMTYGRDSAETAEYTAYRKTMRPELLWFEDDSSWERILEAHEKAGRN